MLESQLSENPATSLTPTRSLRLQRILATILAILTLCLLVAGLVMAADIIRGDLKILKLLLVVAAIAFSCGAVSYSLFRGRGVPSWFLRSLWTMMAAGCVYVCISEIWKLLRGEHIDFAANILFFGTSIYCCISTFKMFWTPK